MNNATDQAKSKANASSRMQAAVCHTHGAPLVIETITCREPVGSQVKVKIGACAVCHSDLHHAQGEWSGPLPAVYGHEAAGVVVATGPRARRRQCGERVIVTLIKSCGHCFYCKQGEPVMCGDAMARDSTTQLQLADGSPLVQGMKTAGFAEYVVVEESQTAPVPAAMPIATAALLSCGVITGVGAVVNTAQVKPGRSVVVIGAGGVGLNAIQGAVIAGASSIIAVDIEPQKLVVARDFGATAGVVASDADIAATIRAKTAGRGADYVFVTVGSESAIAASHRYLGRGGQVIIVGMPALGVTSTYDPLALTGKVQMIRGSLMGQTRLEVDIPWLVALYEQGRLKLDELISNRYPLEAINDAFADTLRGFSLRNVIVMDDTL